MVGGSLAKDAVYKYREHHSLDLVQVHPLAQQVAQNSLQALGVPLAVPDAGRTNAASRSSPSVALQHVSHGRNTTVVGSLTPHWPYLAAQLPVGEGVDVVLVAVAVVARLVVVAAEVLLLVAVVVATVVVVVGLEPEPAKADCKIGM